MTWFIEAENRDESFITIQRFSAPEDMEPIFHAAVIRELTRPEPRPLTLWREGSPIGPLAWFTPKRKVKL